MSIDRSNSSSLQNFMESHRLLFDGAMGTTINEFPDRDWEAPEEVTFRYPDRMTDIYRAYVEAGAHVLTTNTFGGNLIRLSRAGLTDQVEEINRGAAEQARAAAGDRAWVCLLYTSPSPRDQRGSRMPSSA